MRLNDHSYGYPCHMAKLGRNNMAQCKLFSTKGEIQWQFIQSLVELQNKEGLFCGTKLTNRRITFDKEKMKVNLAVETLSKSTSDV